MYLREPSLGRPTKTGGLAAQPWSYLFRIASLFSLAFPLLAQHALEGYSSRPVAGVAQLAEHLFCKQAVRGSSPLASSALGTRGSIKKLRSYGGLPEWPKGADCKSAGYAFDGSNPSPSTPHLSFVSFFFSRRKASTQRGSSSVGRASAFQAERRRFEPGLPLAERSLPHLELTRRPARCPTPFETRVGAECEAAPGVRWRRLGEQSATDAHLAQW